MRLITFRSNKYTLFYSYKFTEYNNSRFSMLVICIIFYLKIKYPAYNIEVATFKQSCVCYDITELFKLARNTYHNINRLLIRTNDIGSNRRF